MNVGNLTHLGPGLRHRDRARHPVCRLHIGDAENIVRIGYRLVEEKVRAAIHKDGGQFEFFCHRSQGGRVAARNDPREPVDVLRQLHAAHFFHIRIGAGILIRFDGVNFPFAQKPTLGVDLFSGQDVALVRRLTQDRSRAGEERHMADLDGLVRDAALGWFLRLRFSLVGSGTASCSTECSSTDCEPECLQKIATMYVMCHGFPPLILWPGMMAASCMRVAYFLSNVKKSGTFSCTGPVSASTAGPRHDRWRGYAR